MDSRSEPRPTERSFRPPGYAGSPDAEPDCPFAHRWSPDRHVRSHRRRPPDLGHRPVQFPLHLLHARRGPPVAAQGGDPDVRGAHPAACPVRPARGPRAQGDRRGADDPRRPPEARRDVPLGRPGARHLDHDERTLARPPRRAAGRGRRRPRDALDNVLAGIRAAEAAGLVPIKINTVVIGGTNDDEVVDFARWARETGYEVRFIEYMPLDAQHAWERAKVVPGARILDAIDAVFPLAARRHETEPATTYGFADGSPGTIGVIASVTEPFCDTCNRLRLTAEGQFRTCLFALDETDLRGPMRDGASDDELEGLIRAAVMRKWSGHRVNHPDFVQPARSMSAIGG